jgi:hypothetical protein
MKAAILASGISGGNTCRMGHAVALTSLINFCYTEQNGTHWQNDKAKQRTEIEGHLSQV